MMRRTVCAMLVTLGCTPELDPAYRAEVETWRADRNKRLTAEDGWLSLAGLYWLKPGANWVGSAPSKDVLLPVEAPAEVGVFTVMATDKLVTFTAAQGVPVTADGKAVTTITLQSDAHGAPTLLKLGRYSFFLIERNGRLGVRLKDAQSPVRLNFHGIDSFAIDPAWRIEARFEAYPTGRTIKIANIIGSEDDEPCPGAALFERDGEALRLEAVAEEGEEDLFFIFADPTNGEETYGAGRFLYTKPPKDGHITLDFNQAFNPPCAFTPYATCPLPPKQNRLAVAVRAGEKRYGNH